MMKKVTILSSGAKKSTRVAVYIVALKRDLNRDACLQVAIPSDNNLASLHRRHLRVKAKRRRRRIDFVVEQLYTTMIHSSAHTSLPRLKDIESKSKQM